MTDFFDVFTISASLRNCCRSCHAAPGDKHAFGCLEVFLVKNEAVERMERQRNDLAFAAIVAEEHF